MALQSLSPTFETVSYHPTTDSSYHTTLAIYFCTQCTIIYSLAPCTGDVAVFSRHIGDVMKVLHQFERENLPTYFERETTMCGKTVSDLTVTCSEPGLKHVLCKVEGREVMAKALEMVDQVVFQCLVDNKAWQAAWHEL